MKNKKTFKNKKQQDEFESFVRNHFKNILECAKLPHMLFRTLEKRTLSAPAAMEIEIDHKYFDVKLLYDENYAIEYFTEGADLEELLRTLCHEASHIPTAEIQDHVDIDNSIETQEYVFERCTQMVSLWLYDLYTLYYIPKHKIDIKTGKYERA